MCKDPNGFELGMSVELPDLTIEVVKFEPLSKDGQDLGARITDSRENTHFFPASSFSIAQWELVRQPGAVITLPMRAVPRLEDSKVAQGGQTATKKEACAKP